MLNSHPTTTIETQAPDDGVGARWLSTADAAKRLDVSPRTVRRRCERGLIGARFIGGVWEVDGQSIGQSDTDADKSADSRTRPSGHAVTVTRTGGQGTDGDLSASAANEADSRTESVANRPIGHSERDDDRREVEAELRAQLAREREFSAILKSQLEAVTQSEAQTKAALREALRAMPKQLTAGDAPESARNRPQRADRAETVNHNPKDASGPQRQASAVDAANWNRVYADLADEIEKGVQPMK